VGVLALALIGPAAAELTPVHGSGDPRLRTVRYSAHEVVRLTGSVGYQIDLEFGEGETFVNLAAGDTGAVDVGAIGNHVLLKPRVSSGATNLLIVTNRRVYHFDYRIVSAPESSHPRANERVMWSVRFEYPEDAAVLVEPPAEKELTAPVNRDYVYRGAASLQPTRVEDDGEQTRLQFGRNAEIPAIFVRDEEGEESLVNFHVDASGVVVHQVASELVVRRGRLVGCIVNRARAAAGSAP
jgi:type IV secretion system protein VirB9